MSNFDKIITESQIRKHTNKEEKTQENINESKLMESEQEVEIPEVDNNHGGLYFNFFNEAVKGDGPAYEFIVQHYWEMSKDELKDILLEYIYRAEGNQDRDEMLEELFSKLYIEDIIKDECPECLDMYKKYMV